MSKNIEKIKSREAKELVRRMRQAEKKPFRGYFVILIIIISMVRMLDEFATTAITSLQTSIVNEFFVAGLGMSFEEGLSTISLISTATMLLSVLATIYAAMSDKVGRRPIMLISIAGMTLGLFLSYLSPDLTIHIIGRGVLVFFISADMHLLYITETAPNNKRATMISLAGFFGFLSMMLVSVSRDFMTTNGELLWRGVFLVPVIVGAIITVLFLVLGRESKVFLDLRIAHLSTPYEGRVAAAKSEKAANKIGGFKASLKYMWGHKQPRAVMLASVFQFVAIIAYYGFYEAVMTTSGMSTEQVTQALFVYPVTCALFTLFAGFFSDKFGRKIVTAVYAILAFAGMIAFIVLLQQHANPYIIGLVFGAELGCFWTYAGNLTLVFSETVPTEIRATAGAVRGLITVVVSIISGVVMSILINFVPLATLCLIWGAATVGLSIIFFMINVKETKDVDLENVISD